MIALLKSDNANDVELAKNIDVVWSTKIMSEDSAGAEGILHDLVVLIMLAKREIRIKGGCGNLKNVPALGKAKTSVGNVSIICINLVSHFLLTREKVLT